MTKVYLAGPITGLTYGNSESWRDYVKPILKESGIDGFSPMRYQGKFLEQQGILTAKSHSYSANPHTTDKAILDRDHWDVMTSDLVLVNVLGAKAVSQGTDIELGFALAHRKLVVLIMEDQGNPHEHVMVTQIATYRVSSLDSGIEIVKAVLLP